MPYKSKRNRRSLPRNRGVISSQAVSSNANFVQGPLVQPARNDAVYNPVSKVEATASQSFPYIINEIKWIGIVTVIIAIILAISYIIFR